MNEPTLAELYTFALEHRQEFWRFLAFFARMTVSLTLTYGFALLAISCIRHVILAKNWWRKVFAFLVSLILITVSAGLFITLWAAITRSMRI